MKSLILFALTAFSFSNAHAAIQNVSVQCDEEGPIFSGTMTLPDAVNFSCKKLGNEYQALNAKQPALSLSFNNLTYSAGTPYGAEFDKLADCQKAISNGTVVGLAYSYDGPGNAVAAYENASGLEVSMYFTTNAKGTIDGGQLGHCGFKANP